MVTSWQLKQLSQLPLFLRDLVHFNKANSCSSFFQNSQTQMSLFIRQATEYLCHLHFCTLHSFQTLRLFSSDVTMPGHNTLCGAILCVLLWTGNFFVRDLNLPFPWLICLTWWHSRSLHRQWIFLCCFWSSQVSHLQTARKAMVLTQNPADSTQYLHAVSEATSYSNFHQPCFEKT